MAKRQQGKDNINHFIQQQGLKKYMVDRPTLKKEPSICVCDEEATTTFSDETEMTVFLLYPNPGKKKKKTQTISQPSQPQTWTVGTQDLEIASLPVAEQSACSPGTCLCSLH